MLEYLVIAAAIASFSAALVYIRSMFKFNTKPNRVTWLMWAIAPLIATLAEVSNNVGWAALPVFMSGFSPLMIFIASFFVKKAYWRLSTFDYICGILSAIALILWLVTSEPNIAIILAIFSDALAAFPTIQKAWKNPETESVWPYIIGVFAPLSSFVVATLWSFSELAFPFYLIIINFVLIVSIYNRKIRYKKSDVV